MSGRSTAESTDLIAEIIAIAHDSGASVEVIIATAWDCPFDGPTPPQRVLDIVKAARDNGVDRLAIADTIGTTTPRRVSDLVAQVHPLDRRHAARRALPQHPRRRPGQRVRRGHRRRHAARRVGRRARRLPVRARRQRQHRHRRPGVPVAGQRHSTSTSTCRPRSRRPRSRRPPSAIDLPSALLRAGDRILG